MIQKPFQELFVTAHSKKRSAIFYMARAILGVSAAIFLCILLLWVNSLQAISWIVVPFSRSLFRKLNRFCANFWWGACVVTAHRLHGVDIVLTGDPIGRDENALIVANHQQMSDILVLMIFARTKNRLGDLKWFVKDIIKYCPGAGWGMACLDCVFVKRNWESDRDKIKTIFSKFLQERIPIWLVSFVEGTRITQVKLEKSQSFARANHLPVLSNVMLPRTKGFVAAMMGLKGHVHAVYDLTIGYRDGIPTLWHVITGAATVFHLHVRRFSVQDLPQDPTALSQWLIQCFREKDELLVAFYRDGFFPSHGQHSGIH